MSKRIPIKITIVGFLVVGFAMAIYIFVHPKNRIVVVNHDLPELVRTAMFIGFDRMLTNSKHEPRILYYRLRIPSKNYALLCMLSSTTVAAPSRPAQFRFKIYNSLNEKEFLYFYYPIEGIVGSKAGWYKVDERFRTMFLEQIHFDEDEHSGSPQYIRPLNKFKEL